MLTDREISRLGPTDKRLEVPEGKVPGLYLVVQPGGGKSWALRCRIHDKPAKLTLGRYPALSLADARALAGVKLKLIAKGVDPREHEKEQARAAQHRKATTFDAVAAQFLATWCQPRNRAWRDYEGVLRRRIPDAWRDRPLGEIARRDIALLVDRTARDAPADAIRLLAVVRKLFNWALEREIVAVNPALAIKPPAKPKVRERVLNDDGIKTVWRACEQAGYPFGPFVRLLLLTGCRRSELAGATWTDVDRGHATLVIPGERYKTGRPHAVPLVPAAMDILDRLPVTGDLLFSTNARTPISGFSKMLKRLIAATGVAFSLHDLRRTTRTGLSRLGVEHHVAERVLGHAQGGVAAHYDHHGYLAEKRRALALWADHLQGLLDGAPAENVVMLRR